MKSTDTRMNVDNVLRLLREAALMAHLRGDSELYGRIVLRVSKILNERKNT